MEASSGASAAAAAVYYHIETCPMSEECNEANFASWRPWGRSEEEARHQVLKHLTRSGKHTEQEKKTGDGSRRDMYLALVEACDCVEKEWEPAERGDGKKRKRGSGSGGGASSWEDHGDGGGGGGFDAAETTTSQAMEMAHKMFEDLQRINAACPKAYPAKPPPQEVTTISRHRRPASAGVFMSTQEFKEVCDSLGRSSKAARSAQRLSSAAAQAFGEEALIFEDVKAFMEAKLTHASAHM